MEVYYVNPSRKCPEGTIGCMGEIILAMLSVLISARNLLAYTS